MTALAYFALVVVLALLARKHAADIARAHLDMQHHADEPEEAQP